MSADIPTLVELLRSSQFVLALLGAGLSATSGLPTFRGTGSCWRGRDIKSLATRTAFANDPVLVWQFYEQRRQQALWAQPNQGHIAIARLAHQKEHFLAITQNIDGLSERAGHAVSKLAPIHGSLFTAKCFDPNCTFETWNYNSLPLAPSLCLSNTVLVDPTVPLLPVQIHELPHCPQCRGNLLRPGVVWFGEQLPLGLLSRVDDWLDQLPRVDLLLVVGTSCRVFPAAEYITRSREKGAKIAHFNLEADEAYTSSSDWFVQGDAAITLADVVNLAFERA
ncbi:hypothetical protein DOTSEDRAFT_181103 [Dothistroma septosporum NZE10]|uniref:Deacetylase sirtuin-type domain-containing protein n=1 Tax=Dothistroma septosporum (strain NZE10 / CBS 128990) TaxID=675120 RepID=M2YJA7_DOTSN|nr:hypothetical protein DOTSEDRAFT_181103 [Dothistroma septosporum NZE10]